MINASRFIKFLAVIIFLLGLLIAGREFMNRKGEWKCQNGQWVKHGNPSYPMPSFSCEEESDL